MLMGGFWAALEGRELETVTFFFSISSGAFFLCLVFLAAFERGVVGRLEAVNIVIGCRT